MNYFDGLCAKADLEGGTPADNAVILKAYKSFPRLRALLAGLGLARGTTFVTRLGHDGEAVERDLDNAPERPHYLSLCLIKRGRA